MQHCYPVWVLWLLALSYAALVLCQGAVTADIELCSIVTLSGCCDCRHWVIQHCYPVWVMWLPSLSYVALWPCLVLWLQILSYTAWWPCLGDVTAGIELCSMVTLSGCSDCWCWANAAWWPCLGAVTADIEFCSNVTVYRCCDCWYWANAASWLYLGMWQWVVNVPGSTMTLSGICDCMHSVSCAAELAWLGVVTAGAEWLQHCSPVGVCVF